MNTPNSIISIVLAAGLACAPLAFAQVYKHVDEQGNVTYSDAPPEPGAEPMDLPELSVVEPPPKTYLPGREPKPEGAEDGAADRELSLGDLRRLYRDFRIVSPAPEQSFWGTGNDATVAWAAGQPLQPGMRVVITVDGERQEPTVQPTLVLQQMDRGEHTVGAELVDERNRRIASADPVTFYVHQNSVNFNQPSAQPRNPGGRPGG